MLYLHVAYLDLGFDMLFALHGFMCVGLLAYVVASTPLVACWMQSLIRYTFVVLVCLRHIFLRSMQCWYACLVCFVPPVWLSLLHCIFARLPTCSCMSLCVIHTPI